MAPRRPNAPHTIHDGPSRSSGGLYPSSGASAGGGSASYGAEPQPSCGARVKEWLRTVPPVTALIVATSLCVYVASFFAPDLQARMQLCPASISVDWQVWRLFTSPFYHLGLLHILFNALATWGLSAGLERALGSLPTLGLHAVLLVLSQLLYLAAKFLIAAVLQDPSQLQSCVAGYSGVIFGLIDVAIAVAGVAVIPWCGLCEIPAKLYPLFLLLLTSLFPGVSIVGHAMGLLTGRLYSLGLLAPLALPRSVIMRFEASPPGRFLLRPPGAVPTPAAPPASLLSGRLDCVRDPQCPRAIADCGAAAAACVPTAVAHCSCCLTADGHCTLPCCALCSRCNCGGCSNCTGCSGCCDDSATGNSGGDSDGEYVGNNFAGAGAGYVLGGAAVSPPLAPAPSASASASVSGSAYGSSSSAGATAEGGDREARGLGGLWARLTARDTARALQSERLPDHDDGDGDGNVNDNGNGQGGYDEEARAHRSATAASAAAGAGPGAVMNRNGYARFADTNDDAEVDAETGPVSGSARSSNLTASAPAGAVVGASANNAINAGASASAHGAEGRRPPPPSRLLAEHAQRMQRLQAQKQAREDNK